MTTLPTSKWRKHQLLEECAELRPHLPKTAKYDEKQLKAWLTECGSVIIKPEWGEGGRYVCKLSRTKTGYALHKRLFRLHTKHWHNTVKALPTWTVKKSCIIQQYIHLAPWQGRPTDIRTIIQRNESGHFEVTGTFIKTAAPHRFVTNVKQGGSILRTDLYLNHTVSTHTLRTSVRQTIWGISEQIGQFLGGRFDNAVYGIDIGLERSGQVWIIEVNTQPNLHILGDLDERMKRRALHLNRYNRTLSKLRIRPIHRQEDVRHETIPAVRNMTTSHADSAYCYRKGDDLMKQEDEQTLGIDPRHTHRANELPSALRVDKTEGVNEEAIRSAQAQNFIINPGRQKR